MVLAVVIVVPQITRRVSAGSYIVLSFSCHFAALDEFQKYLTDFHFDPPGHSFGSKSYIHTFL